MPFIIISLGLQEKERESGKKASLILQPLPLGSFFSYLRPELQLQPALCTYIRGGRGVVTNIYDTFVTKECGAKRRREKEKATLRKIKCCEEDAMADKQAAVFIFFFLVLFLPFFVKESKTLETKWEEQFRVLWGKVC